MADSTPALAILRWPWRTALRGAVLGLALAVGVEMLHIFVGGNFRAVIPGTVYRCSQPSASQLEDMVRTHHIRTIINLRGCCEPTPWYMDEARVAARHDVSLEDLGCSAGRLPPTYILRDLVAIFDRCEYPVLIHCHKGIDRTGLTSGIALVLLSDASIAEARAQLNIRYGHLSIGRTGNLDRFYDLYEEWLAARHLPHSRAAFRTFLLTDYRPGECWASYEIIEPASQPLRVARRQETLLRLRVTNTSVKPWHMHPGNSAGIHLVYEIVDPAGSVVKLERAGLLEATVLPGQHIDLTVWLPGLEHPGRYLFKADMMDEQHASFFQVGSEPFAADLEVQ